MDGYPHAKGDGMVEGPVPSDFFQYLLSPLDPSSFFEEYFEAKHLHIQRALSDHFEKVISFEEIMDFLGKSGTTYPNIQVVRDGQEVPFSRYTRDEVIGGRYHFHQVVDPEKLGELFAKERSSIRIFHAHRCLKKVGGWCRELETVFRCPVQANIYLSPPESRGFGIHFDTHSVFALQLEGAKHWKIFDEPFPRPLGGEQEPSQEFMARVGRARCIYEDDLEKGELLYIPRGVLHEVSSGSLPSIHLTFGVRQHSTYDLLQQLARSGREKLSMRKLLPISTYQSGEFEAYKRDLLRIVEEALDDELGRMTAPFTSEEPGMDVGSIQKFFETCS